MSQPTNSIRFDTTEKGLREMATYIAQLVREGIVYEVIRWDDSQFQVSTTGGY